MTSALALLVALAAADAGARASPPSSTLVPPLLAPVVAGKPAGASPSYQLRGVVGGGYEYDEARFRAAIARDGRVSFTDRHGSVSFPSFLPFLPQPHPEGTRTLEGSVRELFGKKRGKGPPPRDPRAAPPMVTAAGAPPTEQERKWRTENPVIPAVMVSGTMDLTDEYLRLMGEDPYRREKARFLAATFDLRLQMAVRAQAVDLRDALTALPDRLAAIWADTTQPAPARRRLICALWTELHRPVAAAKGQDKASSAERADGPAKAEKAAQAAQIIETFVRTRLPAGGPDAYTAQELAACNDGTRARFAPY